MSEATGSGPHLYETLIRAMSDLGLGVLVTDEGRCIYANDAYCRMSGYSEDELYSRASLLELSDPAERDALTQRLRERLAGGAVLDHYEAGLITKDGRRVDVDVAVKMVQQGGRNLLVSVVRDITDRKLAEQYRARLQEAEWRQEQALQLNDAIVQGLAVAKMAHEVGQEEMSREAITKTLEEARKLVSDLLTSFDPDRTRAGSFVRDRAAQLGTSTPDEG